MQSNISGKKKKIRLFFLLLLLFAAGLSVSSGISSKAASSVKIRYNGKTYKNKSKKRTVKYNSKTVSKKAYKALIIKKSYMVPYSHVFNKVPLCKEKENPYDLEK